MGEYVSLRIQPQQPFYDSFSTSHRHKPVMHQRDTRLRKTAWSDMISRSVLEQNCIHE